MSMSMTKKGCFLRGTVSCRTAWHQP